MAIKSVRAQINGEWHTLTLNSQGKYEATIIAPSKTSFNQSGGYYNVKIEATNDAGTVGTATASTLDGLKFYVRENVAPVITILSPSNNSRTTNNKQPVVFNVVDEYDGSGIKISSLSVKLDGESVKSSDITYTKITNGYSCNFTPSSALTNGNHIVSIDVSDNDGNSAETKSTSFVVDTIAPSLNVTNPISGSILPSSTTVLRGTTNDQTSSPVFVKATINGADVGTISVSTDGTFEKTISLSIEGENTIVVTATDSAGLSTSQTIVVTRNTAIPKVVSASITPNPADAGATVIILLEVVDYTWMKKSSRFKFRKVQYMFLGL